MDGVEEFVWAGMEMRREVHLNTFPDPLDKILTCPSIPSCVISFPITRKLHLKTRKKFLKLTFAKVCFRPHGPDCTRVGRQQRNADENGIRTSGSRSLEKAGADRIHNKPEKRMFFGPVRKFVNKQLKGPRL